MAELAAVCVAADTKDGHVCVCTEVSVQYKRFKMVDLSFKIKDLYLKIQF